MFYGSLILELWEGMYGKRHHKESIAIWDLMAHSIQECKRVYQ